MDRCDCSMCNVVDGIGYCDYYDFMYQKCADVLDCPEDMDDDEAPLEDWWDDDDDFWDTNDTHI